MDRTVLLISRDSSLSQAVRTALGAIDHLRLEVVPQYASAAARLRQSHAGLVLAHLAEPADAQAIADLIRSAGRCPSPSAIVVVGERDQAEEGLGLLRRGAAEYVERPLNIRRLTYLFDLYTVRARYQAAAEAGPAVESLGANGDFLYAPTSALGQVLDQARRVAAVETTILIQGETGTGKTRLARLIHELSPRLNQPFLVVNCAALAANLIESEMFGHVRGAFTGADRDRVGKFAAADDGTLVLDEVDSLPLELQAKLLRVVEDRVFEQVGANRPLPLKARLIAAANRDLGQAVEAGQFRRDLFYRLNVVTFHLPGLRDQLAILPALIGKFIDEFAGRAGRFIDGIAPEALRALQAYHWPGNVRELRNAIERAVALRPEGRIELEDLPDAIRALAPDPAPPIPAAAAAALRDLDAAGADKPWNHLAQMKEPAEAELIREALRRNRNNRLRTAAELGISRMTLYKKLHRYGLIAGVT